MVKSRRPVLRRYWPPAVKDATRGPKAVTLKHPIQKKSKKEDSESNQSSGSDHGENDDSDKTGAQIQW